jgi:hypothetical protein
VEKDKVGTFWVVIVILLVLFVVLLRCTFIGFPGMREIWTHAAVKFI